MTLTTRNRSASYDSTKAPDLVKILTSNNSGDDVVSLLELWRSQIMMSFWAPKEMLGQGPALEGATCLEATPAYHAREASQ